MSHDSQPTQPYDEAELDGVLKAAFGAEGLPPAGDDSVLGVLGRLTGHAPRVHLKDQEVPEGPPLRAQPQARAQLPKQRANYRILGEIARGGMGVILRAHDDDLGRDVALKVLHEEARTDATLVQRFVEEAQISGQLQHPGVVPVYELGLMADERPYFAMKLVKGRTLSALMRERPAPEADRRRFLSIFEQVCLALAYAHARDVIHRDVKPSNVMVGAFGEVQVLDWGLAKVVRAGGIDDEQRAREREVSIIATVRDEPGSDGTVSRPGSVMGTPAYMSPEQARGQIDLVDQRSDVFSLGAVLTEILTGRPPYTGLHLLAQASSARLGPALERLAACEADPELVDLARRCLAEDPVQRPQSAAVVARAIHDWSASLEDRAREAELNAARATPRAQSERKARKLTLALAGVVLLAGAGWLVLQAQQSARRAELAGRVQTALEEGNLAKGSGDADAALTAARRASDLAGAGGVDDELHARVGAFLAEANTAAEKAREERVRLERNRAFLATLERLRTMERAGKYGHELANHASPARPPEEDAQRAPHVDAAHGGLAALTGPRAPGTEGFSGIWPTSAGRAEPRDDYESRDRAFAAAFEDLGVELATQTDDDVRALLERTGIGLELALAFDSWARVLYEIDGRSTSPRTARVLALAKALDPDPLRTRVRDAIQGRDGRTLYAIAESDEVLAQSPVTLYVLGTALREVGAVQGTVDLMRRALQRHPGDYLLHLVLSDALTRIGAAFDEEALAEALVGRALRPQNPHAWAKVSIALMRLGRTEEAVAAVGHAVELDPGQSAMQALLGDAYAQVGRATEAAEAYLAAARLAAGTRYEAGYQQHAGLALAQVGDYAGALREWRKRIESDLRHALRRSDGVLRVSDPVALFSAARTAVEADPRPIASWGLLVHLCVGAGDAEGAAAAARERVARFPSDGASHTLLGLVLASQGDPVGARQALAEADRFASSSANAAGLRDQAFEILSELPAGADPAQALEPHSSQRAAPANVRAAELHDRGEHRAAVDAAQEWLRIEPWDHTTTTVLTNALEQLGDHSATRAAFEAALRWSPNESCVRASLGRLLLASGEREAGCEMLRRALHGAPHNLDVWRELIEASLSDGRREEAAREFAAMVHTVESSGFWLYDPHMLLRANAEAVEEAANACIALARALEAAGLHAEARASVELGRRLAPSSLGVQTNAGIALSEALKEHAAALACFEALARAAPDSTLARENLGRELLELGRPEAAEAVFRAALRMAPDNEDNVLSLAVAIEQAGRSDEAVEVLRAFALQHPESVEAHHRLLHGLVAERRYDEARQFLPVLARLDPTHACLGTLILSLEIQSGGLAAAESMVREALEETPDDLALLAELAQVLQRRNRHAEAEVAYRRLLALKPDLDQARFNLGQELAWQGKVEEAEACFRAYIDRHPEDKADREHLARVLWVQGKRDEALDWYRRDLEFHPDDPVSIHELAVNLARDGREDEAAVLYRKLDGLQPESHAGRNRLAWVFEVMQRYDDSITWYERALELRRDPNSLGNQSWNYSMHPDPEKRWPEEALRLAEEALDAEPEDNAWNAHLGIANYRLEDLDAAVKSIERSLELSHEYDPVGWLFLAMALKKLGREAEARAYYEKGLAWQVPSYRVLESLPFALADLERTRQEARELFGGK